MSLRINEVPLYDTVFILVTVVLVFIAAALNLYAVRLTRQYPGRRMSLLNMRRIFATTGMLAVVYVPFYLSVFFTKTQADWSTFMLGFGIIAWICPWIAIPAGYIHAARRKEDSDVT